MDDILSAKTAAGQTICIFRKNGMAIYGRLVDGQYQTLVMRRGDIAPTIMAQPLMALSLEAELDAELRTPQAPKKPGRTPTHLTRTQADIATRRRQRAERNPLCPLCRDHWVRRHGHPKRLSRDHVKRRADGGGSFLFDDVSNIRWVCQECNGLLDRLGQCPGAVACWIAVGRREWDGDLADPKVR